MGGKRSGTADLPLHHGRVPAWLHRRMSALGVAVLEALVCEAGPGEALRRLADPFWFQAFGAVLGMDWHSSGITTSVLGALKAGLAGRSHALGLWVCGGRGRHSRQTPAELRAVGERTGLDGDALARASQLTAKVDNCAVQDGFQIYLHGFVVSAEGDWAVIQQGLNAQSGLARRYHWRSDRVQSFVEEPHEAIVGAPGEAAIRNLTDHRAAAARLASGELAVDRPEEVLQVLRGLREAGPQLGLSAMESPEVAPRPAARAPGLSAAMESPEVAPRPAARAPGLPAAEGRVGAALPGPRLALPAHHEVRASDVELRRLQAVLRTAREQGSRDFAELLQVPGVGPRTVQALALVSEVVYGAPSRFRDPARFAFAHGGKDGHPHPVPLRVYDETLATLRDALGRARIGHTERLEAFRRLDGRVRAAETLVEAGPSLREIRAEEWRQSEAWGGRTVFGPVGGGSGTRGGAPETSPGAGDGIVQGRPPKARGKGRGGGGRGGQLDLF